MSDAELERRIVELVGGVVPGGPDDDAVWNTLSGPAEDVSISHRARAEAIERAKLGLAIGRGDLTLGRYLNNLRTAAGHRRQALAREAGLSPDLLAELEADKCRVTSVEPASLARLAVRLGTIRIALLELVARAVTSANGANFRPGFTRLDRSASSLEAERASRRTEAVPSRDAERYLSELASAFDAEKVQKDQS